MISRQMAVLRLAMTNPLLRVKYRSAQAFEFNYALRKRSSPARDEATDSAAIA